MNTKLQDVSFTGSKPSIKEKSYPFHFHSILKFQDLVKKRTDTLSNYSESLADFLIFYIFKDTTIASLLIY